MAEVLVQVDDKQPQDVDPIYDASSVVPEYRPLSPWALIALITALTTPLSLISPVLWILPIVGVVLSIIAVRSTTSASSPLLGRKRAVFSLILSIFFLGYAPANFTVDRYYVCRHAHQYAEHWLQLVQAGRLKEAHQLTMTYYDRVAPEEDLEKFYTPKFPRGGFAMRRQMGMQDPAGDLEAYFTPHPLKQMVAAGKNGQYEFVRVTLLPDESKAAVTFVEVHYRFSYSDNGTPKTVPLLIRMKRAELQSGTKHWSIDRVENPDDPWRPMNPMGM